MSDHDDFAFEPVRGLPGALPAGETIIWQGAPDWRRLAITAFHVRKVAIYFAAVCAWRLAAGGAESIPALGWTAGSAIVAVSILSALAWAYARSTVYTLTDRRVVIRSGLTLPVTVNLPLALVDAATVRRHGGGSGSIALAVTPAERVPYLTLWPNVRPFAFNRPQPMLRAIPDVDRVAPLMADALGRTGPGVAPDRGRPVVAAAPSGALAAEAAA
jgi:hypothetical protein